MCPLSDAIRPVTPEAELRAIRLADIGRRDFGIATPRIAVAGLNPHAGENGLFGREDIEAIRPAIERGAREASTPADPGPAIRSSCGRARASSTSSWPSTTTRG